MIPVSRCCVVFVCDGRDIVAERIRGGDCVWWALLWLVYDNGIVVRVGRSWLVLRLHCLRVSAWLGTPPPAKTTLQKLSCFSNVDRGRRGSLPPSLQLLADPCRLSTLRLLQCFQLQCWYWPSSRFRCIGSIGVSILTTPRRVAEHPLELSTLFTHWCGG